MTQTSVRSTKNIDRQTPVVEESETMLPLENGDRLSRPEFHDRYLAMPHVKKAELIEGIVYMPSPVRFVPHAEPHSNIIGWLWNYRIATPGVRLGDNATVFLDGDNEPQPDALLRIENGGNSQITDDDYIQGAPELVVEIAASTASKDLHDKKKAYRRNGVQEYMVWQINKQRLHWFTLNEGKYVSLEPDENGVVRSLVFPGLWLAVPALLSGDLAQVMAVLQEGINSPEHAEFVGILSGESGNGD
ncbi:Uma2 family endonuclease [Microcoleus sp. A2-C5]|uniref:Uma2 family endonuclease n=2 Tax=Microcoleaceae TaxID=1892252 RepID=UPI002237215C|nr:Uma2 family endonuclease [Lyngbya sp. CCAP 1446/10]MCW6049803.1 Uma2 family endonuclease [Lyngbya sp. CCAP 1446/10]